MLAIQCPLERGNSAPQQRIAAKWQKPISLLRHYLSTSITSYHIFLLLLAALAFNSSDNGGNGPDNSKEGAKKQLNRPSQIQQHETIFSIISPASLQPFLL
jgi:hypothetical protein